MVTNYNQYLKLIKEGLIRTHNIEKNKKFLVFDLNALNLEYNINIKNKFKFIISLYNTHKIKDNSILREFLKTVNNLGYYPSSIIVTDTKTTQYNFDIKYLSNEYKEISILFEAKYEDGAYKNDLVVPSKAYHLSMQKFKDKIKYNGLTPKALNSKTKHLERIYMFYDYNEYKTLLETLKTNDILNEINEKYMLLEIKLSDENIIHTDPNYDNGFYTTDNISPNNIRIIYENL